MIYGREAFASYVGLKFERADDEMDVWYLIERQKDK